MIKWRYELRYWRLAWPYKLAFQSASEAFQCAKSTKEAFSGITNLRIVAIFTSDSL